jgi:surface antigen
MRRNEPQLANLGMASQWIANARARGMSIGYTPVVGATAVFQPGVQGAGGGGHATHVVAILSNGWFIISEMNFYWNGGGFARVDYRYVHVGAGVAFIY